MCLWGIGLWNSFHNYFKSSEIEFLGTGFYKNSFWGQIFKFWLLINRLLFPFVFQIPKYSEFMRVGGSSFFLIWPIISNYTTLYDTHTIPDIMICHFNVASPWTSTALMGFCVFRISS